MTFCSGLYIAYLCNQLNIHASYPFLERVPFSTLFPANFGTYLVEIHKRILRNAKKIIYIFSEGKEVIVIKSWVDKTLVSQGRTAVSDGSFIQIQGLRDQWNGNSE